MINELAAKDKTIQEYMQRWDWVSKPMDELD